MTELSISPVQRAFKEKLDEAGKKVFQDVVDTFKDVETVEGLSEVLPEPYHECFEDATSKEEAFGNILSMINFKEVSNLDYDEFVKEYNESSTPEEPIAEKPIKEEVQSETKPKTKLNTKKPGKKVKTAKPKPVDQKAKRVVKKVKQVPEAVRDDMIKSVVNNIIKAKGAVQVDDLKFKAMKEFDLSASYVYKTITAYGQGKFTVSGTMKIVPVMHEGRRGYITEDMK